MTTPPTWTHDAGDNAYTLHSGDNRCRVWYTSMGNWAAIISRRGDATAAYNFATAEAAQTWCEKQVGLQRRAVLRGWTCRRLSGF